MTTNQGTPKRNYKSSTKDEQEGKKTWRENKPRVRNQEFEKIGGYLGSTIRKWSLVYIGATPILEVVEHQQNGCINQCSNANALKCSKDRSPAKKKPQLSNGSHYLGQTTIVDINDHDSYREEEGATHSQWVGPDPSEATNPALEKN
ncbi:hypothetical protein AAG906_025588 [Vitis piasezkii]